MRRWWGPAGGGCARLVWAARRAGRMSSLSALPYIPPRRLPACPTDGPGGGDPWVRGYVGEGSDSLHLGDHGLTPVTEIRGQGPQLLQIPLPEVLRVPCSCFPATGPVRDLHHWRRAASSGGRRLLPCRGGRQAIGMAGTYQRSGFRALVLRSARCISLAWIAASPVRLTSARAVHMAPRSRRAAAAGGVTRATGRPIPTVPAKAPFRVARGGRGPSGSGLRSWKFRNRNRA